MRKWSSTETEELKRLYLSNNIPSDQLIKNQTALHSFTNRFNTRVTPSDSISPEEIADRLLKLRKSGKLPRLRK